ncbi:MAG: CHAT domain-containing protein, partial [Ktedonobacteraceae bacterium]
TTPNEFLEKNALILHTQNDLKTWQESYRKQSSMLAQLDLSVSPTLDQEALQIELKRCETKINELFERLYLQQATRQLVPREEKGTHRGTPLLNIAQLQQRLVPGQLLLAYFLHKEQLVIFAVTTEYLIARDIPNGAQQLKHLLPFLHAHLQPGGWPDPQQPPQQAIRQVLRKLYALLITPVVDYLPALHEQIVIVPYGPLHTLPFHALYDGTRFLIEQFQISYLPASNLLTQVETSAIDTTAYANVQPPLVFGSSGQGYLQHALIEAKMLANMLKARCYLEEEATITRLSEQAPGSPIIHLATHGYSRLDAPNFSAVSLVDGRFNAIDAFSLDLQGCELVTLSGCETGLALSGGGDEQSGLGRAFLASGVHTLVMSLWPVEDSATSELMQLFYQNLLRGDNKVQALCDAQRTLIQSTHPAHTHPYYWAAFRLVGATGPLRSLKRLN